VLVSIIPIPRFLPPRVLLLMLTHALGHILMTTRYKGKLQPFVNLHVQRLIASLLQMQIHERQCINYTITSSPTCLMYAWSGEFQPRREIDPPINTILTGWPADIQKWDC
jgi:hypothetical protein